MPHPDGALPEAKSITRVKTHCSQTTNYKALFVGRMSIIAGNSSIDPISSILIVPRPNDGRVSVESSRLDGMTDHITVKASHNGLLRHRIAIDQTIAFLQEGRFKSL